MYRAINISNLRFENEALREKLHDMGKVHDNLLISKQQVDAILDNAPVGAYLKDKEGRYVKTNKQVEKLFGLKSEDLIGLLPSDVLDSTLAVAIRDHDLSVLNSGKAERYEITCKVIGKNNLRTLLTVTFPVFNAEGEVDGLGAIVTDITENSSVNENLQKINNRFNKSEKIGNVGHWEWDYIASRFYNVSEQYAKLYETTVDKVIEEITSFEKHLERILEDDLGRYIQTRHAALKAKKSWNFEYRCINKNGNWTYIHEIGEPELDNYGTIIKTIGTVQDITKIRLIEHKLQKSHAIFKKAEVMGNIGHWTWDLAEDKLITCSDQFAKIYDMTVPQALNHFTSTGRNRLVHPDDEAFARRAEYDDNGNFKAFNIDYRIITLSGNIRHVHMCSEILYNINGLPSQSFGIVQDISDRKKGEDALSYQASHDALTGLLNRAEFEKRTKNVLTTIKKDKTENAMCFLDLDQFKIINDTCGHAAGDELLRQLGRLLSDTVRKEDTLARLGGDEFGLLMEHCTPDESQCIANDILQKIMRYRFFWGKKTFHVGVSIGLIAITKASGDYTDIFNQADGACYLAKELGRNQIHVYRPDDVELAGRHNEMQWAGRIQQALDENRFCLYAQPIVSTDNDNIKHYELLVRMLGESGEIILPGLFLPAAERYNLIGRIDTWVVERSISLMISHSDFIKEIDFISINLSGQSVANYQFMPMIIALIEKSNIDASKICFEVTETAAISNMLAASAFITELKQLGCRFALDDFGTGLSSFEYLKNLPVDYLKIDGVFVKDMVNDPIDKAMVKSINDIGHLMGMKTTAEFVENNAIMLQLGEMGIDYAQGYGIGMPESFDNIIYNFNRTT